MRASSPIAHASACVAVTQAGGEGLDAWRIALEALLEGDRICKALPRGYGKLKDQLQRAQQNGAANPNAHGVFSFNGAFTSQLTANGARVAGTGSGVADFLLGFPASSSRSWPAEARFCDGSSAWWVNRQKVTLQPAG